MNAPVNSGLRLSLEAEVARYQSLMNRLGVELREAEYQVAMLTETHRAMRQMRDQHARWLAELDEVQS